MAPELPAPMQPDPNFPTIRIPDGPAIPSTPLEALMQAAPGDEPALSIQEMREQAAALSECVDNLGAEDRYLLEGYFYEGLSYRALAQRMGMSKSSVERSVKRALAELRTALLESGAFQFVVTPDVSDV